MLYDILREANDTRQKEWGGSDKCDIPFRALEFIGEVGELAEAVKKYTRSERGILGTAKCVDDIAEEIGDVLICWDLMFREVGMPVEHVFDEGYHNTDRNRSMTPVTQAVFLASRAAQIAETVLVETSGEVPDMTRLRYIVTPSTMFIYKVQDLAISLGLSPYGCWVNKFNATSDKHGLVTHVNASAGHVVTGAVNA